MQAIRNNYLLIIFFFNQKVNTSARTTKCMPLSGHSWKNEESFHLPFKFIFFPEKVINYTEVRGKTFIKQGLIFIILKGMYLLETRRIK